MRDERYDWRTGKLFIQHPEFDIGQRVTLKYGAAVISRAFTITGGRVIYILDYENPGRKDPAMFSQDGLKAHLAELESTKETPA